MLTKQRLFDLEEALEEADAIASGRAEYQLDEGSPGRDMLEWVEELAAEHEDRLAHRCAVLAVRLCDDGDPDDLEEAIAWTARLAARLGWRAKAFEAVARLRAGDDRCVLEAEVATLLAAAEERAPIESRFAVHATFGRGEIVARDGDRWRLRFADGTERNLHARFVTEEVPPAAPASVAEPPASAPAPPTVTPLTTTPAFDPRVVEAGRRVDAWCAETFRIARASRLAGPSIPPIARRLLSAYLARGHTVEDGERLVAAVLGSASGRVPTGDPRRWNTAAENATDLPTAPHALDPVLVADGLTLEDWCVTTFAAPDRDAATRAALVAVVTAFLADGGTLATATASLHGALSVATTAGAR